MGRPSMNVKPMLLRLPAGSKQRILALVGPGKMAAFVRAAIAAELARRGKAKRRD